MLHWSDGDKFQARYNNHKASFTHQEKRNSTELSKHIWQLKDSNTNFSISWKLLEQSTPLKMGQKVAHYA